MERTPYNFCDYRCEHCLETEHCAVFKRLQKDSLLECDDPAGLLNALQTSFRDTETMIKQKAMEFGIDIDEIAGGMSFEEIRHHREGTLRDTLYQEALDFTERSRQFLAAADGMVPENEQEYLNDIAWHHTVVSAKLYRALGWKTEGEVADDARTSAAVAMKSLTICIMAFDRLSSVCMPQLSEKCTVLSTAGTHLKGGIKSRFGLGKSA